MAQRAKKIYLATEDDVDVAAPAASVEATAEVPAEEPEA